MSAKQLLADYNKAVKQLATIYNTNVAKIKLKKII